MLDYGSHDGREWFIVLKLEREASKSLLNVQAMILTCRHWSTHAWMNLSIEVMAYLVLHCGVSFRMSLAEYCRLLNTAYDSMLISAPCNRPGMAKRITAMSQAQQSAEILVFSLWISQFLRIE